MVEIIIISITMALLVVLISFILTVKVVDKRIYDYRREQEGKNIAKLFKEKYKGDEYIVIYNNYGEEFFLIKKCSEEHCDWTVQWFKGHEIFTTKNAFEFKTVVNEVTKQDIY